jgi:hypothetical protein
MEANYKKNFKPLDSFRQGASLEPKKLYLSQFREIAKLKKKIYRVFHKKLTRSKP